MESSSALTLNVTPIFFVVSYMTLLAGKPLYQITPRLAWNTCLGRGGTECKLNAREGTLSAIPVLVWGWGKVGWGIGK